MDYIPDRNLSTRGGVKGGRGATAPSSGNLNPPVGEKLTIPRRNSSTKLVLLAIKNNVKSNLEVTFYIFF